MRISPENIEGLTADELIDFVATHRYKPENHDLFESQDFERLPDYVQHLIFILEFETEYEMQGILTLLQNSSRQYLHQTIDSFSQTDNTEIAQCLAQIAQALTGGGVTVSEMRKSYAVVNQYDVVPTGNIADNDELSERILRLDEQLRPLIEEKGYWQNVEENIKKKR